MTLLGRRPAAPARLHARLQPWLARSRMLPLAVFQQPGAAPRARRAACLSILHTALLPTLLLPMLLLPGLLARMPLLWLAVRPCAVRPGLIQPSALAEQAGRSCLAACAY